jgi:cellulose synthase/poly-beta-1,6-N-acetylglucosamine synthase-like glycosyltransferase
MKNFSEVEHLSKNENNDVLLKDNGESIDLSHKLFMISWAYKNNKIGIRAHGEKISGAIFSTHGIYISPKECEKIVSEYSFLLKKNSGYILFFGVTAVLFLMSNSEALSSFNYLSVLLLPLIFNFCNEITTCIRLFLLNPGKLMPAIISDPEMLGSTAIIIASRNEPFYVAKMTFDSALALVYPFGKKEIIVVDNSDIDFDDYIKWKNYVESHSYEGSAYRDGVRVVFIHRGGTEGFKPRNLDIALKEVSSDFILYLDVDSTVQQDTLLRIAPIFCRDSQLGFIQLHTVPTNTKGKSSLSLTQSLRNYFLRLETIFYTHASHSLFFGHNAMWRTKVVREIGDCLEYYKNEVVVTEDLSMSFRARFKGYYGVGSWLESGEWVPESMRETEAMWLRWTVGTYQVYAKHFTKFENFKKFSVQEMIGWVQHLGILASYGILPLCAIGGLIINSNVLMLMVALGMLPGIIQGCCAYFKLSLGGMKPIKKLYVCYSSFLILGSFINWIRCVGLIRFLTGKKQGWVPTGKTGEGVISISDVLKERWMFLLFGMVCFFCSIYSLVYVADQAFNKTLIAICGLYGLNCIAAICFFGSSRMQENAKTAVGYGDINGNTNFYI